jgi:hypothetical protein
MFLGMPHSFRAYGDRLAETKRWDAIVANGIRWALSKPAASGVFTINTGDEESGSVESKTEVGDIRTN